MLDTQLLLWLAVAPERLPVPLRQLLLDRQTLFLFSVASLWEVAIKSSLGKPSFQVDARALRRGLLAEGLQELPLAVEHCLAVQHLPWVHRDPFDRLLVAAARETGFQLITADRTLLAYGPEVMAAVTSEG
ncbi:MAG: type II toxin-antitoxin system VapC family toxin [Cyanobium sp.]